MSRQPVTGPDDADTVASAAQVRAAAWESGGAVVTGGDAQRHLFLG